MDDLEFQFRAQGPASLADALRDAWGEENRKPSRKRVRSWIREGRVRVEGQVIEDPTHPLGPGDTVDLGPGAAGAAPVLSTAPRPEGILHLDRHLLIVAYEPPVVVRADGDAPAARLARALEDAAVDGLSARPVPAPDARAGGLLAAALSPAAEAALTTAFESREAALTVVAEGSARADADLADLSLEPLEDTGLRMRHEAVSSVPAFLADLDRRGISVRSVPGFGPPAGRPLLVHVTELRLPHPSTGRMLTWRLELPPTFAPSSR